jgi:hypothetical protein
VRLIIGALLALGVASLVGLGTTWLTATGGAAFGKLTLGAWAAQPRNGTSDIDPYARAAVARNGELPVGSGDGVAFYAGNDDSGRLLDGRCDVVIDGVTPAARFWTLTLYSPQGQLVSNGLNRHNFTSQEIARKADGSFTIRVAPRARHGNWIPTGGIDRYTLVMRLYDTPVGVATRTQRDAPMPSVKVTGCP